MSQQKGTVRLYACGGAGINIAKTMEKFRGVSEPGMAVLDQVYIDTSHSNAKGVDSEKSYFFDDMDGSGKVRRENHEAIASRTREILLKFPPMDLNIILSSGSGGSGSVIGPSLVSELLDRDLPVVVIMIGTTDTRLEIDNTVKTIKSYEAISRLRKTPVAMGYFQNGTITPRPQVDIAVLQLISALMTMFSRENSELDSKDLHNFLHFDKVTTFQPQLASLISVNGDFPPGLTTGSAISVATLCKEGAISSLPFVPDYQCSGFLPADAHERVQKLAPVYLVTIADLPGQAMKELTASLAELDQAQRARVSGLKILTDADRPTDTGLVM
jgi:hypothetical protein